MEPGRGTILLGVPSGTAAANLLRTPVFSILKDADPPLRLVVVSPLAGERYFLDEFAAPGVSFESMIQHEPGRLERRMIRVMQEKFVKHMPTESMRVRVARADRAEQEVRYLDRLPLDHHVTGVRRLLLSGLAALPVNLREWYDALDLLTLGSRYEELFQSYHPDLVITPTTGLYFSEGPLLARARRARVPSMAVDLSWDHFTTKTAPLRPVWRLCVWNEHMKSEAVRLHGYRSEQVLVTGVPQFDHYADRAALGARDEFLGRLGARPGARLVTLTTVPSPLFGEHPAIIDHLLTARAEGRFGTGVELLIRVHQRDDLLAYARFEGVPGLHVEKPFRPSISAEGSTVDPSSEDRRHLARTLLHSDVIVNVASTIAIECAIMDTPIVNIGFDPGGRKHYLDSTTRFYDYTHYRPLVQSGAVRVAGSPEQMVAQISRYLQDAALDRDGRARAARMLAGPIDGQASHRIARHILAAVGTVRRTGV